jgi:hypothetical protein
MIVCTKRLLLTVKELIIYAKTDFSGCITSQQKSQASVYIAHSWHSMLTGCVADTSQYK